MRDRIYFASESTKRLNHCVVGSMGDRIYCVKQNSCIFKSLHDWIYYAAENSITPYKKTWNFKYSVFRTMEFRKRKLGLKTPGCRKLGSPRYYIVG